MGEFYDDGAYDVVSEMLDDLYDYTGLVMDPVDPDLPVDPEGFSNGTQHGTSPHDVPLKRTFGHRHKTVPRWLSKFLEEELGRYSVQYAPLFPQLI